MIRGKGGSFLLGLIVLGFVLFYRLSFLDPVHFGRSWDENGYLASAVHIRKDKSFETNFEVPPLAKIYLAMAMPRLGDDFYVPLNSPLRMGHDSLGLAFWEKISAEDQEKILSHGRTAQAVLAFMSLLLIVFFLTKNISDEKIKVLSVFLVSSSSLIWGQAIMATTEGLSVLLICAIMSLAAWIFKASRGPYFVDFLVGVLCGPTRAMPSTRC